YRGTALLYAYFDLGLLTANDGLADQGSIKTNSFSRLVESAARHHVAVPCMKTQEASGVFAGAMTLARKRRNRTGSTAEYPLDSNRKEEDMYYNANGEKVSRAR